MDWPRFWWTLAMVGVCLVFAGLLALGWRNRRRRQSQFPPLPVLPTSLGEQLTAPITGIYVSTVFSGQWQNRIVASGLGRRAKAELRLYPEGVVIDRLAEEPLWVPAEQLREVGTTAGTAGKVMATPDAILLITWAWGVETVASGVRSDDLHAQLPWIAAAQALVPDAELSRNEHDGVEQP